MDCKPAGRANSLWRFFGNPVVGIAGSLASIVGLALAINFFWASQRVRDLRYFVHPAKAVVVRAGQSSRLRITLDGAPVERDVAAVQVAFWNQGNEPIREEHMLEHLVIRTNPKAPILGALEHLVIQTNTKAPILEARLRKAGRGVSGIALDLERLAEGEVHVRWTIVEQNDGGVVQLIYLDDVDTAISATATVEGQGDIHGQQFAGNPEHFRPRDGVRVMGYVYLALGALLALGGFIRGWFGRGYSGSFGRSLRMTFVFVPLMMIVMSMLLLWSSRRPGPPFGFE